MQAKPQLQVVSNKILVERQPTSQLTVPLCASARSVFYTEQARVSRVPRVNFLDETQKHDNEIDGRLE